MDSLPRPRSQSVTFVRSRTSSRPDDIPKIDDNEIDITLAAPYIQQYLALNSRGLCCGLPIPFERASRTSWWNPKFDSDILEGQYKLSAFTHLRLKFRYALAYILLVGAVWGAYFRTPYLACLLIILIIFLFTFTERYKFFIKTSSLVIIIFLFGLSFLAAIFIDLNELTYFALCCEIILLIYTLIPLPLYLCIILSLSYSLGFEILLASSDVLTQILRHLCVHLIGIHCYIMSDVRMRGTFMKVGQSLLVRRQLEMEKQLKEKMIHSVMPPKVADWLLSDFDLKSLFRPFNMSRMDHVSILFADIVGFTRMSSTKSAEELVSILNDLFERFDELCAQNNCEKISTLGDCYYCVSGCPEPNVAHAQNCVEMGLRMIDAIKDFDQERGEGVNMRVGIHTGTVLCGVVGIKRFKFDVWSNDVTYANLMESTGQAGRVHISEGTKGYLTGEYILENGEDVNGLKTYFIVGRTSDPPAPKLIISPSPQSLSPQPRPRFLSASNPNELSPHLIRIKASSLPSILDETEDLPPPTTSQTKSPTASNKIRNWLFPPKAEPVSSPTKTEGEEESKLLNGGEMVDVKSYISQSRSDCSDFRRGGSFKVGLERQRSATVVGRTNLEVPGIDQLSVMSGNSRKDSGIKSTSRRSSIQQQIFALNQAANSHADIFQQRVSGYYTSSQSTLASQPPPPIELGVCVQKLRKQSDLQLIRCVQDNTSSKRSYFLKPPLRPISLLFKSGEMECEYRRNVYSSIDTTIPTLATARYNTFLDVAVSFIVFIIVTILLKLNFEFISMGVASIIEILALSICFQIKSLQYTGVITRLFSNWLLWHLIGGILISIPILLILINQLNNAILIGLINFLNFNQLNCWLKNILILIYSLTFINYFNLETILNLSLLLILIVFLNRQFEISYRLSFHSNVVANRDKLKVQNMKNQADWLLHNIIPKHVADQLKKSAKYSENHKNVGIIFASIVNFNEMYDESYMGGKEFLRVLNELIGDFDQLSAKFAEVDKIKTIGSTFMAASGLNPQFRENHLYALMDFAIEMQQVIDEFNKDLLEFNLILRIGFNCGDVTAGVIGTSKLYYDIWGDAVNIASRMDSTGVNGRIQVGEACLAKLESKYEFESRGSVYVKGKDNMNVYLLVRKKPEN